MYISQYSPLKVFKDGRMLEGAAALAAVIEEAGKEAFSVQMTTTKEITVYEQHEKTYCEDCKPKGGKRSTLVVSSYDHFCAGCGQDLRELAESYQLNAAPLARCGGCRKMVTDYHLGEDEILCVSCIQEMAEFEKIAEAEYQLQQAWDSLQAVPAYTEQYQRYHAGLSAFFQVVALLASQEIDPLSLDWEEANLWRELQDGWEEVSYAASC